MLAKELLLSSTFMVPLWEFVAALIGFSVIVKCKYMLRKAHCTAGVNRADDGVLVGMTGSHVVHVATY